MKKKHAVARGTIVAQFTYTIPLDILHHPDSPGVIEDLAEIQLSSAAHFINNEGCPGLSVGEFSFETVKRTEEELEE